MPRAPRIKGCRVAPPVLPSAGLTAVYNKRLQALIDEMNNSILYWVRARWRETPPTTLLATDYSWFSALRKTMGDLIDRWTKQFTDLAPELASYFAKRAADRSTTELKRILKDHGWTVEFKKTRAVETALQGIVEENVALIKSIATEHLFNVQQIVMRSVNEGGDLHLVTSLLRDKFDVPKKRAELIARDQNRKAMAAITRIRQTEAGITQAVWMHSSAGKVPRPEHVAFAAGRLGGPVYDVRKGAYLEGKWTWPGVEINCRCTSRPVIPGF